MDCFVISVWILTFHEVKIMWIFHVSVNVRLVFYDSEVDVSYNRSCIMNFLERKPWKRMFGMVWYWLSYLCWLYGQKQVKTLAFFEQLIGYLFRLGVRGCTGAGQNNGNTTETVRISLLIWCWTTFCLQYSRSSSWNGLVQVLNSL
jgi:hypothetical protein